MTTAVILAAGASSRMGFPKAILHYQGETFLARWVRLFRPHAERLVVVAGEHLPRIAPHVPAGVVIVRNPDPARGMMSSLQCGLEQAGEARQIWFTPVDLPLVRPETLARLATVAGEVVIPCHGEHRGHPVRVSRAVANALLALPAAEPPNRFLRAQQPVLVQVDDPGVCRDVDDPAAFQALPEVAC